MNTGLFLYRSALKLFSVTIRSVATFNPKAKLFVAGRKDVFDKIAEAVSGKTSRKIWFHCASLGEFEQGRPLIETFKTDFPDYEIFLTFYSPSGYEVRKNYALADYVYYLPLDGASNSKKFIDLVDPQLAIFVKYEFWYYYLYELKRRNIPVLSISSIFRPDQLFFKSYGSFYREILGFFTHFFVQDNNSKLLLQELGIQNVTISGDTRFDRVFALNQNSKKISIVKNFKNQRPLLVIGSSWKEDLDLLIPFINKNAHGLQYIIAPHEIDENTIEKILTSVELPVTRYSKIKDEDSANYNVLIIDNIGLLSSLYKYGEYAYIGGAFGKGLHNILEAATYGVPVIFGDRSYAKFKEANDLIEKGGAFAVGNDSELNNVFEFLSDPVKLLEAGEINSEYIKNNIGATDEIINYCKKLLDTHAE